MGEFVSQILKGTPVWVWAILVALIVLGVKQLRARVVKRYSVLVAPVVFLVIGLMAAGRGPIGLLAWAIALFATAAFTFFVWQPTAGARYDANTDRLNLPGSAIPMLIMLSIFLLNYVINVALAIKPALRAEFVWQVGPAIILGALSGVFIGRALTLFCMNRIPSKTVTA
jgi:NhaP-type Na+/H+ and K+/H+ antiporter